jgi:diguanylate cyclase (GGDEF)-like protein
MRSQGAPAVAELCHQLSRILTLPPLGQVGGHRFDPFLRGLMELFRADAAALGFWTSPHEVRRFRAKAGESGGEIHEDVVDPGRADGPIMAALRQGAVQLLRPGAEAEWRSGLEGGSSSPSAACLLIGLKMRDEPPAALTLHRSRETGFTDEERKLAEDLAPVLSACLDNLRRFGRAEELSITDGLTGAFNYRYLRSALDREIARAKRFRERFAIIMLDVDHLKEYNDVHGHLQGSEVLRRVAQVVVGELRGVDVLAKYGGDEFVVILPRAERSGAGIFAERIRAAVEAHAFPGEEAGMKITTSMGIAQFPEDGETSRDLLESADTALYDAKRSGRNRVTSVAAGPSTD